VHADDEVLQVQDDVGDVLFDAGDGRELVRDALDADTRDRGAAQRGQQDATEAVAEGVAEASVERLDGERAATVVDFLGGDSGDLEISGHEFLTLLLLV
jgi:hypothetical protein